MALTVARPRKDVLRLFSSFGESRAIFFTEVVIVLFSGRSSTGGAKPDFLRNCQIPVVPVQSPFLQFFLIEERISSYVNSPILIRLVWYFVQIKVGGTYFLLDI